MDNARKRIEFDRPVKFVEFTEKTTTRPGEDGSIVIDTSLQFFPVMVGPPPEPMFRFIQYRFTNPNLLLYA